MNILEIYETKYFGDYDKEEEHEEMLKAKKKKKKSLITFHQKPYSILESTGAVPKHSATALIISLYYQMGHKKYSYEQHFSTLNVSLKLLINPPTAPLWNKRCF